MRNKPTTNYRSGPKKGLPKYCECGGKIIYVRDFSRWFTHRGKCTPVVKVNINELKPTGVHE